MNSVMKQLLLAIGPTILKEVIKSILSEDNLVHYRDELVTWLRAKAAATTTTVDNALVESAVSWIMEPGNYIAYTNELMDMVKKYVAASETPWDDTILTPVLDQLHSLGLGK